VAARLAASEEGLSSMKLDSLLQISIIFYQLSVLRDTDNILPLFSLKFEFDI
jgi:hypothetical protein